jgi:nucleoside-diphosphate-sugar epimerase
VVEEGIQRVLITGSRGYLGSVLVPVLLDAGLTVTTVDRPRDDLPPPAYPRLTTLAGDPASLDPGVLAGVDAVVALAAARNNPAVRTAQDQVRWTNCASVVRLARAAKAAGVGRFLFASSCSVYGNVRGIVGEDHPAVPLSGYAHAKLEAERCLAELDGPRFRVVSLRAGTLFGAAPRFRSDLLLNAMVVDAMRNGCVDVPSRPYRRALLHVRDAAAAYLACLTMPAPPGAGATIWNVVGVNVTLRELGEQVAARVGVPVRPITRPPDRRSYWVSGGLFERVTGMRSWRGVATGIDEVADLMASGDVHTEPTGVRVHNKETMTP